MLFDARQGANPVWSGTASELLVAIPDIEKRQMF
jgi:hypothetical protein